MADTPAVIEKNQLSEITNSNAQIVAKAIKEEIGDDPKQFFEDGFARTFNKLNPNVPNTNLRGFDQMLFKPIIYQPGSINTSERVKALKEEETKVMLTSEGKTLVDSMFTAFDQFKEVVGEFKGGGWQQRDDLKTIPVDGKEVKKYKTYQDYYKTVHSGVMSPDHLRYTYVSKEFKDAMQEQFDNAVAKLDDPEVSQEDLTNFYKSFYLLKFAQTATWSEQGAAIDKRPKIRV